jgi:hypothetical protein
VQIVGLVHWRDEVDLDALVCVVRQHSGNVVGEWLGSISGKVPAKRALVRSNEARRRIEEEGDGWNRVI